MWGVSGRSGVVGAVGAQNRGFQQAAPLVHTHSNRQHPLLTKLAPERAEVVQELHEGGAFGVAVGGAGAVGGAVLQPLSIFSAAHVRAPGTT